MANKVLPNNDIGQPYPTYPKYSQTCHLNEQIQSIPQNNQFFNNNGTGNHPLDTGTTYWRNVPSNPSTLKHLYSTKPLNYEQRYTTTPIGTLYDHDYSQTWTTGEGRKKILGGGHYKTYPLTNANIRESHDYNGFHFERPSNNYYQNEVITISK